MTRAIADGSERVTCIIPAHRSKAWIGEAIDSVLGQTRAPDEVVVIDSGDDGSSELARSYGEPVRAVEIEDLGPAHNRNRGIEEARFSLLAFLDADDRWLPRKLELQLALLAEKPELGGCVSHAQPVWDAEVSEEGERYRDHPRAGPVAGYATITLLAHSWAFERVGPLREELWYSDSTDWFLRAKRAGVEIELMDEVLVEHRIRASNLTRRGAYRSRAEFLSLLRSTIAERRKPAG